MVQDGEPAPSDPAHRTVPSLPRRLADPTPVLLFGTALWFAGVVLFGWRDLADGAVGVEFFTCIAGTTLGIIGYGVFRWQRSAARRGSRGSWQGLSGLDT
ncbi:MULTISPECIES: DUF2530 domain-containing protein [Saccharopolyspora]|uniref:DUF2530 domain-containing protein n=2 Tax=Saccharopolyspora TaxID=1835 RepID=A0A4R5C0M2_9PSEU|nr:MULTISPECIES: DUF2530 domain-containing protein [Saccharopolyspora]MBQ0926001.1 DUF2530 domain-containing protein [Saccharopolyspora endophytica]TDD92049.1 DUF2530 domain-containing protein [Saccharopolyspora karakumensis]